MLPWNDRKLQPPPIHTFYCSYDVDVTELKYLCESISRVLAEQYPLHQESAIISRFIYRYDKKFRNDLGYRKLKKLNTCLRRYLEVNLRKDIDTFKSTIPSDSDNSYLPTRQMLEYVLVRILSFSMIMLKICVVSKQAAIFYMDRIKRGESFWMSLLPYASICRIWSISSVLIQYSSKWYQSLFVFLKSLELKGQNFLDDNIELPQDIKKYLNLDEVNDFGRFDWTVNRVVNVESILNENEFDEAFDLLKYVQDINENTDVNNIEEMDELLYPKHTINIHKSQALSTSTIKKTDVGQVVSRESFRLNGESLGSNVIQTKTAKKHDYLTVKTTCDLKTFIKDEDEFRNTKNENSLTNHLSFMQWLSLKQSLLEITKLNNKQMLKKLKIIWRDKCLDYL